MQEHQFEKETSAGRDMSTHWHSVLAFVLWDIFAVNVSYFLALWFRFDCKFSDIPISYLNAWKAFTPFFTVAAIGVFFLMKVYRGVWKYASFRETILCIAASIVTTVIHYVGISWIYRRWIMKAASGMPVTYFLIGGMLQLALMLIVRFSYRFVRILQKKKPPENRVMLIGGGSAGRMILRDMQLAREVKDQVVCIIDDDASKWHGMIEGVPVVGGRHDILAAVEKYNIDKIFIAIPSASPADKRDILSICQETGCKLKNLPGMYQLVNDEVTVSVMRDVSLEDLLGRSPIRPDMEEVFKFIHGRVVMVTGGGGSIGSELCRQVAAHQPKQLIIFDIYENSTYEIQLELKKKYPDLDLVTLIGSVRDSRRMFEVFSDYRPQVVYHAAAHKHVPLMEDSPNEAIKNNSLGTYKTAYAAMVNGCERFVLISTDKAVNPTNIMGASKRLCEMIIQSFDEKIKAGRANEIPQLFTHEGVENADKDGTGNVFRDVKTEFVAVRFGNVLGSNGSVIPLFKKQIEAGGPVTVTHPDIVRYFMTIPEAVSLVLLAGTYATGGEIYVLNMGEPVKIDDLAKNLIRLSGYKVGEEISIEYVGLRPGEKLYEEKLMAEEGLRDTANKMIHIGNPIAFDVDQFLSGLEKLMRASYSNKNEIRDLVRGMVSTYHPEGAGDSGEKKAE